MSKVISVAAALQHCTGLHDSTQVMGLLQGAVPSCLARVLPWGISMFPFAFCLPVGSIPGWHKWSFHQLVDMSIDWSASRASSSSFSAFVTDRRAGVSSPAGMPALVLAWRGSHACLESWSAFVALDVEARSESAAEPAGVEVRAAGGSCVGFPVSKLLSSAASSPRSSFLSALVLSLREALSSPASASSRRTVLTTFRSYKKFR